MCDLAPRAASPWLWGGLGCAGWSLPSSTALPCRAGSVWTHILVPCSAGRPWLLLPRLGPGGSMSWEVSPGSAGAHCAGQETLGTCVRGHLLQLHHFPHKPGLEEVAGGLGGVRG